MLNSQSVRLEKVTAVVDEILIQLKQHYEQHKKEYAEAYQAYRLAALEIIGERATQLDLTSSNK